MAYLTAKKLSSVMDVPVCLPAVELLQGDWLVIACIKLIAPMRLTYRHLTTQMISATVDTRDITADNKVSANLGLAFVGFYKDYTSGHPGQVQALDVLSLTGVQTVARSGAAIVKSDPGLYYLIVANNMKPSTALSPLISPATSIDFKLLVTGSLRLELNPA